MTLDDFAKEQFRARLAKLSEQLEAAHRNSDDAAIHDLRVAIRRFSQALLIFREVLPGHRTKAVRQKLIRLMKAAGKVRNLDVVMEAIGKSAPDTLQKTLKAKRCEAAAQLDHRLDFAISKDWVARWKKRLKRKHSDRTLAVLADEALQPAERDFLIDGDRASEAGTGPAALHKFRIAAKRLRYTLELFAPLDEAAFEPRIEAMRELQQILGDVHDCVVNAELVRKHGGPASIERRLLTRQRKQTASFRRAWPKIRIALAQAQRVEHPAST